MPVLAALLARVIEPALGVEMRGDAKDHGTGVHHERGDLLKRSLLDHRVDDDDSARSAREASVLEWNEPRATGRQNLYRVRVGPNRRRATVVWARHRKRGPVLERNSTAGPNW